MEFVDAIGSIQGAFAGAEKEIRESEMNGITRNECTGARTMGAYPVNYHRKK
jgi:hypothetical protein